MTKADEHNESTGFIYLLSFAPFLAKQLLNFLNISFLSPVFAHEVTAVVQSCSEKYMK